VWQAVVDDWRSAPLRPELKATLEFLEKLTLRPDELTAADADEARAAGVSDQALRDAAMHGPSEWSPGERELFAGFTSLLNQCPF